MNEEQKKQYEQGTMKRAYAGAQMWGAISVWMTLEGVPLYIRNRMAELVAEYEEGSKLIDTALAPPKRDWETLNNQKVIAK